MSIYYPSDCTISNANYLANCCPTKEGARIRHLFLQKTTYAFVDIEDATEWETAIAAGNILIIPNVRGSSDGGNWTTTEGYGDTAEETESFEETITFNDKNFLNNVANYNTLARGSGYYLGFVTATRGYVSSNAATFKPKRPISSDAKQSVTGEIEGKFVQSEMPIPFTYPQAIFDCFRIITP